MILFYYYKKGQTDRQTAASMQFLFIYQTVKIKTDEMTLPSVTFTVFAEQIVDRLGLKCGKKLINNLVSFSVSL